MELKNELRRAVELALKTVGKPASICDWRMSKVVELCHMHSPMLFDVCDHDIIDQVDALLSHSKKRRGDKK